MNVSSLFRFVIVPAAGCGWCASRSEGRLCRLFAGFAGGGIVFTIFSCGIKGLAESLPLEVKDELISPGIVRGLLIDPLIDLAKSLLRSLPLRNNPSFHALVLHLPRYFLLSRIVRFFPIIYQQCLTQAVLVK